MINLDKKQMKSIKAGSINGTILNAIIRGATVFVDVGRYMGSSVRRIVSKNLCRF